MRRTLLVLGVVAAVLAAAWAIELVLLQTSVLTPFGQKPALTPLYAFLSPKARPSALLFPLLLVVLALSVERLLDEKRTDRRRFALALAALAAALPFALFLVRQSPGSLGAQLTIYPGEEVYYDAIRIETLGEFWRRYTDLMPKLSLHGKHFPPGQATIIWIVGKVAGTGTLPVAVMVLAVSTCGILCCWRALEVIAGASAARQGALLLLACPSLLDFACTSMDAVFFAFAALALWAASAALAPGGRTVTAVAAGLALLAATLLSFSALPLGFALLVYAGVRLRGDPARIVRQLGWMAAGYALPAVLLRLVVGFDLWRCYQGARRLNEQFMTAVIGKSPGDLYSRIAYGNLTAFAIGAGLALMAAIALRGVLRDRRPEPFSIAVLVTLALMIFGGLYQLETERIWLFAMPWLAALAVAPGPFTPAALRVLLIAGGLQALALEILTFTLW